MLNLLLLLHLAAPAQEIRPQPARTATIDSVRWMIGCWASAAAGDDTHEYWFTAGADALIGLARTTKNGRLAAYEHMVIRVTPAGLAFIAKPSGQTETTFVARPLSGSEVVFENPAHDFPQRVIYRPANGALEARVEGTQNGKARGFDVQYRRIACP
jgi:hypothetical protein